MSSNLIRTRSLQTVSLTERIESGKNALKSLIESDKVFEAENEISHVVLQIVVNAEIKPLLEEMNFTVNEDLTKEFLDLATVHDATLGSMKITALQVAQSKQFRRHYSGYSQSSAIAALIKKVFSTPPDLVISFGTCGGFCDIGEVVIGRRAMFVDRIRLKNDRSFNWGIWGGNALDAANLVNACELRSSVLGSQISYQLTKYHMQVIESCGIECLDMECAPIAQILNQVGIPLLIVKVVSNGIYSDDPKRMEKEYVDNREFVCQQAVEKMRRILNFLEGKRIQDL